MQSVALRFIVDREKAIEAFKPEEYWRITARFDGKPPFEAVLEHRYIKAGETCPECGARLKTREIKSVKILSCPSCKTTLRILPDGTAQENIHIPNRGVAEKILAALTGNCRVASYGEVERRSNAAPPFITSTLQQAASNELGFSALRTMRVAQQLYEGVEISGETVGLITYMRTDSFNVAGTALTEVREFIRNDAGEKYLPEKPNYFRSRKSAQEAHEAVRPTSAMRTPQSMRGFLDSEQFKLYDLVWRRFVASQCAQAVYKDQKVELRDGEYGFVSHGRIRIFDGSEKYWPQRPFNMLPKLDEGAAIKAAEIKKAQNFTEPPARFTEAALVKTLEKEGIGRPSTYATIISTLLHRGYVIKKEKRFHPTELGRIVAERLLDHFPHIMDAGFTAQMETALDEIEEKQRPWIEVLKDFWHDLEPMLKKALEGMEKMKSEEHPDAKCPECGGPMLIRLSRRGKFLGCKNFPKCKGTSPMPGADGVIPIRIKAQPTGEKCPKCGKELLRRASRRGPFIGCSGYPKCRFTKNISTENKDGGDKSKETGGEDVPDDA